MTYDTYKRLAHERSKRNEAKEAKQKKRSKGGRRRKRQRRIGGKKEKVMRWGQLAARLAANFDFAIVALAVSPLVKSSLKDFVVPFSFLACTIRCHDLCLPISLAVSFLSRAFSLSCSYAPFPSQADSFSLAHFFPFPLLPRFFFIFYLPISRAFSFFAHPPESLSPPVLSSRISHIRPDYFPVVLFANTIYQRRA